MATNRILAGPILRRCEPKCINLWLATLEPLDDDTAVELYFSKIIENEQRVEKGLRIASTTEQSCVQVLPQCFLYMLRVELQSEEATLPAEQEIFYDIVDKQQSILSAFKRLDKICLKNRSLPSFILQGKNDPLRIAFASCRYPHHDESDAILGLNARMFKYEDRPHLLLLGGDQIYADEVSPHIAVFLDAIILPNLSLQHQNNQTPLTTKPTQGALDRNGFLKRFSDRGELLQGFSSSEKDWHLISWLEFIGMYLLAWGSELIEQGYSTLTLADYSTRLGDRDGSTYFSDKDKFFEPLLNEIKAYELIFANTPVLMVGDDHEFTDDWSIDSRWIETNIEPRHDEHGEQSNTREISVHRHATLSYFLCQVWGNDPTSVANCIETLKAEKLLNLTDYTLCDPSSIERIDESLQKLSTDGLCTSTFPSTPPIIILDTRIDRKKSPTLKLKEIRPGNTIYKSFQKDTLLFGDGTLERLRNFEKGSSVILMSPSPIFNYSGVDSMQAFGSSFLSSRLVDHDGWRSNYHNIKRLVECFSNCNVFYLSGDVHYSYACEADLHHNNSSIKMFHLVSSGTKNTNARLMIKLLSFFSSNEQYHSYDFNNFFYRKIDNENEFKSVRGTSLLKWRVKFGNYRIVDKPNILIALFNNDDIEGFWMNAFSDEHDRINFKFPAVKSLFG